MLMLMFFLHLASFCHSFTRNLRMRDDDDDDNNADDDDDDEEDDDDDVVQENCLV